MPEGPEAANMAQQLNDQFQNSLIETIEYRDKAKHQFLDRLPLPSRIINVYSYGKKVIFQLVSESYYPTDNYFITVSLGMTGRFSLTDDSHARIILTCRLNQDKIVQLYYHDMRCFGRLYLTIEAPQLINLGPDILTQTLTLDQFQTRWFQPKYQNKQLVQVLMDQSFLAGIGNYLKSTILYRAGLNPSRRASSLTPEELDKLCQQIYATTHEAYERGGMTIKDYLRPDGSLGTFDSEVYQKTHDPQGRQVEHLNLADKRRTFWVPEVQH